MRVVVVVLKDLEGLSTECHFTAFFGSTWSKPQAMRGIPDRRRKGADARVCLQAAEAQ